MNRSKAAMPTSLVGIAALCVFLLSESPAARARAPEQVLIDSAINRGVSYLKGMHSWLFMDVMTQGDEKAQQDVGVACLVGLTLLECGSATSDESVARAYRICKDAAPRLNKTYPTSLAIMFLSRYGHPNDMQLIKSLCLRLVAAQSPNGGWTYTCTVLDAMQERAWEKWLKDHEKHTKVDPNEGGGLLGGGLGPDNSNTQFAILALWLGRKAGLPVHYPLLRAEVRFRTTQSGDGGWGYGMGGNDRTKGGMTCVGLLALALGLGNAMERTAVLRAGGASGEPSAPAPPKLTMDDLRKDPAVQRAQEFIVREVRQGHIDHFLYFLWSLERVCVTYEWNEDNWWDWYGYAATSLLKMQRSNGSWSTEYGTAVDTCLALLVLRKADLVGLKRADLRSSAGPGAPAPPGGITTKSPAKDDKPKVKEDSPADAKRLGKELITSTGNERAALLERLKVGKGAEFTDALAEAIPQLSGTDQAAARRALAERLGRMMPATLKDYLEGKDRELKLAAAVAAATKGKTAMKDLVPLLIPLLDDFDEEVKDASYAALKALSGEDFGRSPIAWTDWLRKQ